MKDADSLPPALAQLAQLGERAVHYVPDCPSPLSWQGGKYYQARRLAGLLPPHKCYVEVFCGAAWLFFRKSPSPVECLNDIDGDLINFFEMVRQHPEELAARAELSLNSRQLRAQYLAGAWPDDPLERAFRFYYLLKTAWRSLEWRTASCYNSGPAQAGNYRANTFISRIRAAHARLAGVTLEHLDWQELIRLYDREGVLFYLDPPYPGTRDRSYQQGFDWEDCARLAQQLARLRGRFLLSINDAPEARQIFARFQIHKIFTRYVCATRPKKCAELVISNFPIQEGLNG